MIPKPMLRFISSRNERASRQAKASTSFEAAAEPSGRTPRAVEVVFEIGMVLALHLAVALAICMTLDTLRV